MTEKKEYTPEQNVKDISWKAKLIVDALTKISNTLDMIHEKISAQNSSPF